MKLSDNLKRIRKENNLSQEQLAEKIGVSRQAVSKWESGQSYPEMDKVLLICKLFNYNIDELMNENIKEVDETKQSKMNINKYIDDFFEFITKTVDMFSSMKFNQKFKCFMEQVVVGFCLFLIFLIIGSIAGSVAIGILGKLSIYYIISDILESIYIVFAVVIGVTILLHVFKVRYLDYYEFVKEDNRIEQEKLKQETNAKNNDNFLKEEERGKQERKIFIEKKKEKVVIRDPNHSQSKFLEGIVAMILYFIKFIAICIALWFVFTFVILFCLLITSFLFVKTGLIFLGALLCIVSGIIINFIILELFYNFIVSKNSQKTRMAISFLIGLVLMGTSIGIILIGVTDFNYVEESNPIEEIYHYQMTENLSIENFNGPIEYIEEDSNDIKMVIKHSAILKDNVTNENELICVQFYQKELQVMETIKTIIHDINQKEIKEYYNPKIYVYTSKENIEKLKQNKQTKYYNSAEEEINELYNSLSDKEVEIMELENLLGEKEITVDYLEQELDVKELEVVDLQNQLQEKEEIINSLEEQIIMNEE